MVPVNARLDNNIIYHVGTVAEAANPGLDNWSVAGTNNWVTIGTSAESLRNTLTGVDPGFADPDALDFTLRSKAAAANQAETTVPGLPEREYFENETIAMRYRIRKSADDLGAFESSTSGGSFGPYDDEPVTDPVGSDADADADSDNDVDTDTDSDTDADTDADVDNDGGAQSDGSGSGSCGCNTPGESGVTGDRIFEFFHRLF